MQIEISWMAGNQSRADSSGQRKAEAAALVDGHHALAALVVAFLPARLLAAVQAARAPRRQAPPVLAGRQADRGALLVCCSHQLAVPGGCGGGIGIGCS